MQGDRVFTGQGSHVTGMVPSFVIHFILFFSHHLFPNLSLILVPFYEVSPVILLSLYETLYRRHIRWVLQFVMYCCTWIYLCDKYLLLCMLYQVQKNKNKQTKNPNNYQVLVTVCKVWVLVLNPLLHWNTLIYSKISPMQPSLTPVSLSKLPKRSYLAYSFLICGWAGRICSDPAEFG